MSTGKKLDITNLPKASGKVKPDFVPVAISMAVLTGMFLAIQKYFFRTKF